MSEAENQPLLKEKDQIIEMINEAISQYESRTGKTVVRNTNTDNYHDFAEKLNEISHRLRQDDPDRWNADKRYSRDDQFDIKAHQITYSLAHGSLKPHVFEALHWYIYGVTSRKLSRLSEAESRAADYKDQLSSFKKRHKTLTKIISIALLIAFLIIAFIWITDSKGYSEIKNQFYSTKNQLDALKRDMRILPYQPTRAEINRLEGVYMVYTASPQARASDPDRYHKVVPNILVVTYKNGYFTFDRYGHDFDQKGFMQFERSGLVSMHSYMLDSSGKPSPKKSLLDIENGRDTFSVISTSWSFDPDPQDNISIGIREVFIKIGKHGSITQIVNSPRNFGKAGKLFDLKREDGSIETIHIQNIRLENLSPSLQALLNEKSILLKDPDPTVILEKPLAK
jgi:hypothetical protein